MKPKTLINNAKFISVFCLILGIVVTSITFSAWATQHAINGGPRFTKTIRTAILEISRFPSNLKSVVGLLRNYLPPKGDVNKYKCLDRLVVKDESLSGGVIISALNSNGFHQVMMLNLASKTGCVIFENKNLRNLTVYSDVLPNSESRRQSAIQSRNRVWHPNLSKTGLLVYCIPWNDLVAVDLKTGSEKWRVRGAFHHSIEVDDDGDYWVCGAAEPTQISNGETSIMLNTLFFEDQIIAKISKDGKIIKSLSVSSLLVKSGLEYLLFGAANPLTNFDPIHLNQISPILRDSGVFKKGQILISLRNISTVVLLDPETEKVCWHKIGPWMNQHSVVPIGPSVFSILDNHSFASGNYWIDSGWKSKVILHDINLGTSKETVLTEYLSENLKIPIEGRVLPMADGGWILEDCYYGTLIVIKNGNIAYKWSNLYPDGTVGITSWCRFISAKEMAEYKCLLQ